MELWQTSLTKQWSEQVEVGWCTGAGFKWSSLAEQGSGFLVRCLWSWALVSIEQQPAKVVDVAAGVESGVSWFHTTWAGLTPSVSAAVAGCAEQGWRFGWSWFDGGSEPIGSAIMLVSLGRLLRVWASSLSCGNKAPDGECWVRLMSTVERRRWSDESRPLSSKGFPTTNGGWVSSDDYMSR